jgi:serine-type D-Ala-D-Ala carboxypeptidase (penicillin-binding protein 5/6)
MRRRLAGLVMVAVVALVVVGLARPLPSLRLVAARVPHALPGRLVGLAWPSRGEGAVGVEGVGLLGSSGSNQPTPIASVAKVMTAYIVLRDRPLSLGAAGPQIRVTPTDVEVYEVDEDAGQSVAAVRDGERLSERQALEALLLPSANNVATMLARWDAGSEAAFVVKMNAEARALGLAQTHYADASGAESATVSTAADQVRLAMSALELPAVAQIVAMPEARLPVAGMQFNLDRLLGTHGIVGVKTGSTSAARGCFVFAAHERIARQRVTVVGSVLGQPATLAQPTILQAAFHATTALLNSIHPVLETFGFGRGTTLAWVKTPWADPVAARSAGVGSLLGWRGLPLKIQIAPTRALSAPLRDGQSVGMADIAVGEQRARVRLLASAVIPSATLAWRLSHP